MRRILRFVLGLLFLVSSITIAVAEGKDILVGNSYILKDGYDGDDEFEVIFLENNIICCIEHGRIESCGRYQLSGNTIIATDFEGEESGSCTVSKDGTFLIIGDEKFLLKPYDPNYLNGKREAIDKYIEKCLQEIEDDKLYKQRKKLEEESIEKFGYIDSLYIESNGTSKSREENVLSVWSFTDEIEGFINAGDYGYKATHPNVEVGYRYIPTDQFQDKLDPVLAMVKGAPDVFTLEDAFVRKYVESGLLLPLDDLYEEVKDKMADYPIKVGSYNGHVYAMSWLVCPGAMFYRRSYAKRYWGTDDPVEVQKKVNDLETFVATARELNRVSNGKCKMVSTYEDLFLPYKGARKKPWIINGKLNIDPALEKYMETAKIFHDEKLDGRTSQWAEGWYAGMKDTLKDEKGNDLEVMCYFLPTWGLHYVLKQDAKETSGDWAMCAGPAPYRWGGTWIAAYKGTKKPEAAKEMIRYLATDDKFLEAMANSSGDVVGNYNVQNKIKGNFSESYLRGQNHYAMFCELSKNVDGSLTQGTDQQIEALWHEAVEAYVAGEKTKRVALYYFKQQVATTMGYIYSAYIESTGTKTSYKENQPSGMSFNESSGTSTKASKIGISMPTNDLQRWNMDGANMKYQLEKLGYQVELRFANNDIATQVSQIENMVTGNCKVLIIAPIDGTVLRNVLDTAKKKKISVISYDRLIMNSDAVSYYVTFDNYKVGTTQGDYLVEKLGLKRRLASNPVYMEFFTGDLRDNNINFYFGGAMDVLKPYIDNGVIVCQSKQTTKSQCATSDWSTEEAQKRMENLIKANGYGPKGKKLDAVYCSNDSIANGVTNALISAGYDASNFPIITGQDCDIPSVKNILKGFQSMSVFKDTHTLASKTVEMADAIVRCSHPYINDTRTYDNGAGIIPSYLCEPLFVTKENYKSLLIDSGYYTEEQLKK